MPSYSEYSSDDFSDDLTQLKSLVEKYQSGGKSGNRFFTVSHVDGKLVGTGTGGRYTVKPGQSPGDAARRAFTQVCRKHKNKSNKTITLRETTQGSSKKEYSYNCKMVKLSKPRKGPIDKKTGKPIMFHYESHCSKASNPSKGGFYI